MPLRLNDRDVVPPGVASVRLGNIDIVAKPPKPIPVAWVAQTSLFYTQLGILHFADDTPHDGGSIVTRYELIASGETAATVGAGAKNGRLVSLARRYNSGSTAVFPNFTASSATFTVVAINALGTSEASDSFTLAGLPGGTAVQRYARHSFFKTATPIE